MNTDEKIRQLRTKMGITQSEFADKMFVSRELVSKWELDLRKHYIKTTEKWRSCFACV